MRFSIQELYSIFSQTYFWILIFEFAHSWFKFYLVSLWFEWLFCVSIFGLILGITFSCFFSGSFRSASMCGATVCSVRVFFSFREHVWLHGVQCTRGDTWKIGEQLRLFDICRRRWSADHCAPQRSCSRAGRAARRGTWPSPAHAATGFASRPREVPGVAEGLWRRSSTEAGPKGASSCLPFLFLYFKKIKFQKYMPNREIFKKWVPIAPHPVGDRT
jgi:hypothetical protein